MNEKNQRLYGIPYAGIAMNVKNQRLLCDHIFSKVMNVKNQQLSWDLICRYCNVCIKPMAIKKPICKYCIYEMALWNL